MATFLRNRYSSGPHLDGMTRAIGAHEVDLKRAAFQIGHDVALAGG
jgi:hypothetical protein